MAFAIIQTGYGILGVGETEDEAIAMAREFSNNLPEVIPTRANTEGDVIIKGATPRLVAAVMDKGGDIAFDLERGVADLADA